MCKASARFGQRHRTAHTPPGGSALHQGRGALRRRPAAAGGASPDLRALLHGARTHNGDRQVGGRGGRRPGVRRCRHRHDGEPGAADAPGESQHVPAPDRERNGPLRGRHRRRRPRRDEGGERRRRRAGGHRIRPAPGGDRPGGGGEGRGPALSRCGHQHLLPAAARARPRAVRLERRRRHRPVDQPAPERPADRAPVVKRPVRRGRAADPVDLVPDAAPGQDGARDAARVGRRAHARGGARRGRRVRGQGPRRRGRAGRLDGAPDGQAGSLDRDAQREHGGHAPWPGDGARVRAGRHARRRGPGAQTRHRGRLWCVSDPRGVPAQPDRDDVERRLPDPEDRD